VIWGVAVGLGLGFIHLLAFQKMLAGLFICEGSGSTSRSRILLTGGRFAVTTLAGGAAIGLGVSPVGLAVGLLATVWMARLGFWLLGRSQEGSKEISA
jgi:hypothetical protein